MSPAGHEGILPFCTDRRGYSLFVPKLEDERLLHALAHGALREAIETQAREAARSPYRETQNDPVCALPHVVVPPSSRAGARISKGNVPARLNAQMNIRIALEGVVPMSSVASKNRSFSCGETFATTGVILSAMMPELRLWYDLVRLCYTLAEKRITQRGPVSTTNRVLAKTFFEECPKDFRW